jgi:outer membrane protein TolC
MFRLWLTVLMLITMLTTDNIRAGEETLDLLITTALTNNPGYKAVASRAKASAFSAEAAGALPDPNFSVALSNVPRSSLALDETPMSGVALGLTQTIPWPGKLKARSRWAGFQNQRAETEVVAFRNRLVRDVTVAYYDYSYWTLRANTIRENIALIDATTRVTEEQYAQGEATAHDVLQAQTTGSRLEIRLLNAEQMRQSALVELYRTVKDSTAITNLPPYLPEPSGQRAINEDFAANPVLRDAKLAIKQAEAGQSLARSDFWPDIMVGAEYRLREASPGDPLAGENFISFKVGVSLPLWSFSKQKNNVKASQQMLLASRERERQVHDILGRDIENARLRLNTLSESIERYDKSILPQARAGLEAAEIAYEVARVDFDALLSSFTRLLDVELERLELVHQINETYAVLQELTGNSEGK